MSSWIVNEQSIKNIVALCSMVAKDEVKNVYNLNLDVNQDKQKFALKIFDLNLSSYAYRYNFNKKPLKKEMNYKFENFPEYVDNIQTYKNLNCLLYQCSEGNFDKTKMFKFLSVCIDSAFSYHIISGLSKYGLAKWE